MVIEHLKQIFLYNPEKPLLFTQLTFWIFFCITTLIYSILYKKNHLRNAYLLVISLLFYYKTGGILFLLILFSTLIDYTIGLLIYLAHTKWKRKIYLTLSIITNLLVLSYFKYTDFFIHWLNHFTNLQIESQDYLAIFSNKFLHTTLDIENIILPVGISFYTFQTMSYTIDLYRGKIKPVTNLIDFAFYVSFFPQLVAGPIVRAASFVPQLYKKYKLTAEEASYALLLIINGLIKKILISDFIAINFIDPTFADPLSYTGFQNLSAIYAYSIQIYCDFSGYTDIALGTALLLGFNLPLNFNSPYKAIGLKDFWKRWHISLSTWLRDYLYIPLGGNKKGRIRTYINLIIVMLLGGLWHGASIRFVIWGAIHGIGLALTNLWIGILPNNIAQNKTYKTISWIITFHFVTFAWLPFRAENIETVKQMLHQIIYNFNTIKTLQTLTTYYPTYIAIAIAYFAHWLPTPLKESIKFHFITLPTLLKILLCATLAFIIYHSQSLEFQPFIYFQF